MHPHVARANQSRLQQEESQPSREYRRMDVQNGWPRNRGVDQVLPNRKTEPEYHDRRNHQRHRKVKIVFQKAATPLPSAAVHRRNRNAHIRGAHSSPLLLLVGTSSEKTDPWPSSYNNRLNPRRFEALSG